MLMDEPFGAVDPIVRERLQDQFLDIQERLQKTIVFVTHDIDEAIKMADRIAILNVGGVIEQYASPEEILREPANDFVKQFVGAERGLKRLALVSVGDIELEEGPVVGPNASQDEAIKAMDRFGFDWVSVVDDGDSCRVGRTRRGQEGRVGRRAHPTSVQCLRHSEELATTGARLDRHLSHPSSGCRS